MVQIVKITGSQKFTGKLPSHTIKVTGLKKIKAKLRFTNIKMASDFRRGLGKAAFFLQRKSQEIVPVELGNLKNSAGMKLIGSGWGSDAIVYYTAHYAVYVHEIKKARHKAGKEYKFLEKPARIYRDRILKIIGNEARIK